MAQSLVALFWVVMQLAAGEARATAATARGIEAAQVVFDLHASMAEKKILLAIARHESRWDPSAINPKGGDCGELQVRHPIMWGTTCERMLADRSEAYHIGLRILRYAEARCPGTWARVLTMYASGVCGKAPMKARELCEPIGMCDEKAVIPTAPAAVSIGAANDNAYARLLAAVGDDS